MPAWACENNSRRIPAPRVKRESGVGCADGRSQAHVRGIDLANCIDFAAVLGRQEGIAGPILPRGRIEFCINWAENALPNLDWRKAARRVNVGKFNRALVLSLSERL
jgi:hypothetical protein